VEKCRKVRIPRSRKGGEIWGTQFIAFERARIRRMPTMLRSGPYRFYFYSHEPNEPPHIHVDRDDSSAKFWIPCNWRQILGFALTNSARYNYW
jgi:Domain of unknown function (DUF4160)